MPEPYTERGLSAVQLADALRDEADRCLGELVAVAYQGRGGVLWDAGQVRIIGTSSEELERAIAALLDDADTASRADVLDALLSLGGARLVVHRVTGAMSETS